MFVTKGAARTGRTEESEEGARRGTHAYVKPIAFVTLNTIASRTIGRNLSVLFLVWFRAMGVSIVTIVEAWSMRGSRRGSSKGM